MRRAGAGSCRGRPGGRRSQPSARKHVGQVERQCRPHVANLDQIVGAVNQQGSLRLARRGRAGARRDRGPLRRWRAGFGPPPRDRGADSLRPRGRAHPASFARVTNPRGWNDSTLRAIEMLPNKAITAVTPMAAPRVRSWREREAKGDFIGRARSPVWSKDSATKRNLEPPLNHGKQALFLFGDSGF